MNLVVAAAQYPISEHSSFGAWQAHTERWIAEAAGQNTRLLVFPEYGSMELVSIFPDHVKKDLSLQIAGLHTLKDKFCDVFAQLAWKFNVTIVAPSMPVMENGQNLNRVHVFTPKGLVGFQDKFFMTRFENEEWGIESAPKILTVFEAPWGRFGIQICYDVEFALGSQLLSAAGAKLILAPSCTETIRGATRVHIGARARALENQVYTVVSQTVGDALWSPAVDINYGYAAFYSTPDKHLPEDGIIASMAPQKESWLIQELDFSVIEAVRMDGNVFNFKDQHLLKNSLLSEEIHVVYKTIE